MMPDDDRFTMTDPSEVSIVPADSEDDGDSQQDDEE